MNQLDEAFRAAVAGMVCQAGLAYLVPLLTPDQHLIHDYVSSSSAVGQPLVGLAILFGYAGAALHLVFVRALWDGSAGWVWGRLSAWLFGAFFVFITLSALFQCDPRCALETREAFTHFLLGLFAFTSLGLSALVLLIGLWRKSAHSGRIPIMVTSGVLILADLALLTGHLLELWPGLVERLTIGTMWVWTVVLYRYARSSAPALPGTPSTAPH